MCRCNGRVVVSRSIAIATITCTRTGCVMEVSSPLSHSTGRVMGLDIVSAIATITCALCAVGVSSPLSHTHGAMGRCNGVLRTRHCHAAITCALCAVG